MEQYEEIGYLLEGMLRAHNLSQTIKSRPVYGSPLVNEYLVGDYRKTLAAKINDTIKRYNKKRYSLVFRIIQLGDFEIELGDEIVVRERK